MDDRGWQGTGVTGRNEPTRLGELVKPFLREKGMERQVERVEVLEAWPELVGERLAEVTRAAGLAEGTLFVEVRSSAWLMELNMMKSEVLARVNESRDDATRIERLVFVQGEG